MRGGEWQYTDVPFVRAESFITHTHTHPEEGVNGHL